MDDLHDVIRQTIRSLQILSIDHVDFVTDAVVKAVEDFQKVDSVELFPKFDEDDFEKGLVGRFTKHSPGPVLSRKLHLADERRGELNELVRNAQKGGRHGIKISLWPDRSVYRISISPMINFGEIWITY